MRLSLVLGMLLLISIGGIAGYGQHKQYIAELEIQVDGTTKWDGVTLKSDRALESKLREYGGNGSPREIHLVAMSGANHERVVHVMRLIEKVGCCFIATVSTNLYRE